MDGAPQSDAAGVVLILTPRCARPAELALNPWSVLVNVNVIGFGFGLEYRDMAFFATIAGREQEPCTHDHTWVLTYFVYWCP